MNNTQKRSLDALVAKNLGYRVERHENDDYFFYMLHQPRFQILNEVEVGERGTEADAWADCPHFTSNMNDAMQLINRAMFDDATVIIRQPESDRWTVAIFLSKEQSFTGEGDILPLALSQAWLAYRKAVKE